MQIQSGWMVKKKSVKAGGFSADIEIKFNKEGEFFRNNARI